MTIQFDRPVGAAGDVKELEYVSALHQTDPSGLRTDGSIRDEDIQLFLVSRYGIDLSVDYVRDTIVQGLGGGSGEDDCIDLMEVVAILLIPTILKAAQLETSNEPLNPKLAVPKRGLLAFVLGVILQDVTGTQVPKQLDATLVRRILKAYGEVEIAEDANLVDAMVEAAHPTISRETEDAQVLDLHNFARALTYDVNCYDITNEIRMSSHYDDIFGTRDVADDEADSDKSGQDTNSTDDENPVVPPSRQGSVAQLFQAVQRRITFSPIDFVAGTYRSKTLTVLLWAAFIMTYFAYDFNFAKKYTKNLYCPPFDYTYKDPWSHNRASIACEVGRDFLKWIIVFTLTSIYGAAFVGLGSIGNSAYTRWFGKPLIGMMVVFWVTFVPFWTQKFVEQQLSELSNKYLRLASLILGTVVCFMHLTHAAALYFSPERLEKFSISKESFENFRRMFDASTLMGEVNIKHAAAHKLGEMVQNAYDLIHGRENEGVVDTKFGHGLLAFSKRGKKLREDGGFWWTWKRVFNNELIKEEGIWLSARFLASNIAQYIVSIFVLLAGIGLTVEAGLEYGTDNARQSITKTLRDAIDLSVNESRVTDVLDEVTTQYVEFLKLQAPDFDCGDFFSLVDKNGLEQACGSELLSESSSNCIDYMQSVISNTLSNVCQTVNSDVLRCDQNSNFDFRCALIYLTPYGSISSQTSAFLNAAGYNVNYTRELIRSGFQNATDSVILTLYPARKFMVMLPLVAATLVAFSVSIYLATIYLPSVTSTILQLRSGVIPTLQDRDFHKYRSGGDRVTIVTGSMFWGALFSSALVGGVIGIIVFGFVWQVTVFIAQKFLALIAGLLFIIILKRSILACCRCAFYRGFYRKKPATANVTSLALECANFALSVGFIFIRMIFLILISIVYIGRIDTPVLAPGVGNLGPLRLDGYPYIYREDILSSEAHRHPYIETLGVMYLMKIRYGDKFGKTAGSCWRLLFVYALMPWLHKYRVLARPDLRASSGGFRSLRNMGSSRVLSVDDDKDDDDDDDDDESGDQESEVAQQQRKVHPSRMSDVGCESTARSGTWQSSESNTYGARNEAPRLRSLQYGVPASKESPLHASVSKIDHVVQVLKEKCAAEASPKQSIASTVDFQIDEELFDERESTGTLSASFKTSVGGLDELNKEMEEMMMANDDLRTKLHAGAGTKAGRNIGAKEVVWE